MKDQNSTIRTPKVGNPELAPALGQDGELQHRIFSREDILNQSNLREENENRLNRVPSGNTQVRCYLTKGDTWVVELRSYQSMNHKYPSDQPEKFLSMPRIKEFMENAEVGAQINIRGSDAAPGMGFRATRALLEKDYNVVVAAQTDNNPHGYSAEFADHKTLDGFELQDVEVTGLRALKVPRTVVTKISEEAGFDSESGNAFSSRITHTTGLAELRDGEWLTSDVLPAFELSLQTANATAIQYAQSGFEGIAAKYDRDGNVVIPRLQDNAKRMQETCKSLGLPPLSEDQFSELVIEVVKQNLAYIPKEGGKLYIRPFVAGYEGGSGANSATSASFQVNVWPFGDYLAPRGKSILVEARLDLHRPATGANKVAGNYSASFEDKKRAKERTAIGESTKYKDILMFDQHGRVEELSSCAAFFIERQDNELVLVTPPITQQEASKFKNPVIQSTLNALRKLALNAIQGIANFANLDIRLDQKLKRNFHILPSINRDTVIEIAKAYGLKVEIRDVTAKELASKDHNFVRMFSAGTAAGITDIAGIDLKKNENDNRGVPLRFNEDTEAQEVVLRLYDALNAIREGQFPGELAVLQERDWLTVIPT